MNFRLMLIALPVLSIGCSGSGDSNHIPVNPPARFVTPIFPPVEKSPDVVPTAPSKVAPPVDVAAVPSPAIDPTAVPAAPVLPREPVPHAPVSDPRAKAILGIARNHEKDKRTKAAVRSYSEVVNGFPNAIEAPQALARLKAMGENLIADAYPSKIITPHASGTHRVKRLPDFSPYESSNGSMGGGMIYGGGGGGSSLCGAPTKTTGAPCRNPVAGGGYCYLHR